MERAVQNVSVVLLIVLAATGFVSAQYTTVQDEGTTLPARSALNFTGAGVRCSDDGGATNCAVDLPVLFVDEFAGADVGEQIENCVAALLAIGGTCDASRITGTHDIAGFQITGRNSVTLILGNATFRTSQSIELSNLYNFHLKGHGAPVQNSEDGTRFLWIGPPSGALLDMADVGRSVFEDFSITTRSTWPLEYAVRMYNSTGGNSTPGLRIFRNINVFAGDGSQTIGSAFFWDASCGTCLDANNELDTLYNVHVSSYTGTGFRIDGTQSKTHTFYSSSFFGNGIGDYGVRATGGSFRWYGGDGGGYNDKADFRIENNFDPILISGANLESSARLLDAAFVTSAMPVTIVGTRWTSDSLPPDGRAILYEKAGGLQLIGNAIGRITPGDLTIHFKGYVDGTVRPSAVAIGNMIGSTVPMPFTVEGEPNSQARWILQSNMRADPHTRYRIQDQILNTAFIADIAPSCGVGDFIVWADSGTGTFRKCENGVVTDLDTDIAPDCGAVQVDPPSITALSTGQGTATATGVAANDACACSPRSDWHDDLVMKYCFVSAPNTLAVRLFNASGAAINAGAVTVDYCCQSEP